MEFAVENDEYIPPVRCPQCGERQNRFHGRAGPDRSTYDRIDCMVCGRVFESEEYRDLVSEARSEPNPMIEYSS